MPLSHTKTFIDRAIETYNFHCKHLKEDKSWTFAQTAELLNRSIGGISEDLLVAQWMKSHAHQIIKFTTMKDTLKFIRDKKKELMATPIDA